jgi:hypothetical protein
MDNNSHTQILNTYINLINKYLNKQDMIELKNNNINELRLHIYDKFPLFKQNYPYLLDLLISGKDLSILNTMLNNIDRIDNANDKEKELQTVRYEMANLLNDKYVKPYIKK